MSSTASGSAFVRPHVNIGYGDDRADGIDTLPDLVEFAAKHNPDHIFGQQLRANDPANPCIITFSQLASAVERASAWLVGVGATTGRTEHEDKIPPVALLCGSDITLYIYMCALLRIGAPVLQISARLTPVAILHLLKSTNPSAVIVSSQVSHAVHETIQMYDKEQPDGFIYPKIVESVGYESLLRPTGALAKYPVPPKCAKFDPSDVGAFIMHSSGTTGLPKPIGHSQAYPLLYPRCHRIPEQDEPFRYQVSTLPLYHGFGLMAPSLSLGIGIPFVMPPAATIPTGKSALAMLNSTGARYLLTVPSILEDIVNLPDGVGLKALQELEYVVIGGAALKDSVGDELVNNGVHLLNHWGTTEIGCITPIQRVPTGHDWHYLIPRSDTGLKFLPSEDGSGGYHLVGRAPGWAEDHVNQDLLEAHPQNKNQFRIMGRADDLIVLATGEKVRPTTLEQTLCGHPDVKDVLAFGNGQTALGLIVELRSDSSWDINDPKALQSLRVSIDPYLEKGNSFIDAQGKVTRDMIVFAKQDTERQLLRADKGSLLRKANWIAFEADIKAAYEHTENVTAAPLPLPSVNGDEALLTAIRSQVEQVCPAIISANSDTADFFEAGMDSLQATRLRRALLNGLKATRGLPAPVTDLESDFIFENSSTVKLFNAVKEVMEGAHNNTEDKETKRIKAMEDMEAKYRLQLASYAGLAAEARQKRKEYIGDYDDRKVILLTGSTGSLGCFLLARFAGDASVRKVYCLNRAVSGTSARERQIDLMGKRGAKMDEKDWEKVEILEAEPSKEDLGLGETKYNEIVGVTHIIHNAWPVNFSRNLASFEPHIKAFANLFRLAVQSSGARPSNADPTRVIFTSSIAVASHFHAHNPNSPAEIPEIPLGAINSGDWGYPEGKWVGERIGLAANEMYGQEDALVQSSAVRIGQMTGPEGSGAWNESEHVPLIVQSCSKLAAVPELAGSFSWIPVNRACEVLSELLFAKNFRPVSHLENPSRQSWEGFVEEVASILGGSQPLPIIPFGEWLDKVKAAGEEKNPAHKVLNFLETNFVHHLSAGIVLDTSGAKRESSTLVNSTAIGRQHLEEYIAYWRRVGDMQQCCQNQWISTWLSQNPRVMDIAMTHGHGITVYSIIHGFDVRQNPHHRFHLLYH